MPSDALLNWKRNYHGYVVPSLHHLVYPALCRDDTEIEGFPHFFERGLLTSCLLAPYRAALAVPIFVDFALMY